MEDYKSEDGVSEEIKVIPPKAQKKNKPIIILRIQSKMFNETTMEELEDKYSKKFGCKVVILESNLEMVDYING